MARSDQPATESSREPRVLDYQTPVLPVLSPSATRWLMPLLLILGAQCWLVCGHGDYGRPFQQRLLLGALVLSFIAPVNRFFYKCLDCIRNPSPRAMILTAIAITILASAYFPFTGWYQGRDFSPKWQDELSYLIQFQMLSHGRLWMSQHPVADFFDSFQLLVKPVYASIYFPGAALLYTPMKWLAGGQYWIASAVASGAVVGLMYLIMTELIDGVAGVLGAVMVIGLEMFRKLSLMIGGHPPFVLLFMLMIYCWLRWRREQRIGWAVALGIFAGWSAITRPLDALVIALPIGIDMLLCLRRQPLRRWLIAGASVTLAALPFLTLQLIFNIGVTGKWSQTPFEYYADRDYPGTTLGFHPYDPSRRPLSTLPQKQKFHDEWTVPAIKLHEPAQTFKDSLVNGVPSLFTNLLPHRFLFILVPAALLGLFVDRRRVVLLLILPIFLLAFAFYTFRLPHYGIICLPVVIMIALVGARAIETSWPRLRQAMAMLVTLFVLILSVTETAELNRMVHDEWFVPGVLRDVARAAAGLEHKPAVILIRFADRNPHEEPVYNTDVAWPDDAPVIRAHDLGERNIEIFRYYAEHQPQRAFYLFDRTDESIHFLGFAPELARRNQ